MGLGDWIIASAQVKQANEQSGLKVRLGDGKRFFYEPEIFDGNPRLAGDDEPCVWVPNFPGHRPYIRGSVNGRLLFNDNYRVSPGELFVDATVPVGEYIVVEPGVNSKYKHTINKAWPYWDELLSHDLPWLQLGPDDTEPKTRLVKTNTFREALRILKGAKAFVGTDGALHHAAAALGIPAVVIWTGFSSPRHLGYDSHINLHDGSEPCGTFKGPCPHCARKAAAISPEEVLAAVRSFL